MTQAPVEDLDALRTRALSEYEAAATLEELNDARGRFLGRRGELTVVQRGLGQLPPDQRRTVGGQVNAVRGDLLAAEADRRAVLEAERDRVVLAGEAIDVTLPARVPRRGSLHPLHETMEAMVDLFVGLGYVAVTGPEVESDWFNFQAMNMPPDHPARSLHDTIYVQPWGGGEGGDPGAGGSLLLRTHTSPVQARTMLAQPPPVYVVVPGRVYRQDTPDATHLPVFHQIEGLAVDTDLSMADLRGTLAEFVRALLGPETRTRLIPDYFPFTEPSCQLLAEHEGRWLELLGAGMVHPNVLTAVGYDPEQVQGFAFGIGVDRIAMLRHGVTDLRLFGDNDTRFLQSTA